ncbi:MAG: transporter substrate-binding domain-containing protein [Patescibacteria group bacterium]
MKKIVSILFFVLLANQAFSATSGLFTPEETLWLSSRNDTIVLYPEANNPPYSYQSPAGNLQGLSVDYIELVAEKIGARIEYLTPRSRSQLLSDFQAGKGDVTFLTSDPEKEKYLIFTESYITVPVVIVVRKDYKAGGGLTLNDFQGKKVALVAGSTIENFTQTNYPRVVREGVTDNEVGLQQVVLGEVDAAVMDVASLSFYLSKQVLSSVKIAGNTGLDYKPAFSLAKGKETLQSILEKGLSQISATDRQTLTDKWIFLPGETKTSNSWFFSLESSFGLLSIYILFGIGFISIMILLLRRQHFPMPHFHRVQNMEKIKKEISELEGASETLAQELSDIRQEEGKLKEKLEEYK